MLETLSPDLVFAAGFVAFVVIAALAARMKRGAMFAALLILAILAFCAGVAGAVYLYGMQNEQPPAPVEHGGKSG